MSKTYKDLLDEVKQGIASAELAHPEAIAKSAVGIEDGSVDLAYVQESTATVTAVAATVLAEVPGLEDAQIEAAQYGILLDQDPLSVLKQKRSVPHVDGKLVAVESGMFGESDLYDMPVVANEAFDGQIVASNTPYSFGVNLVMAKQDDFVETIYPTLVLKPGVSGCAISTTVEKIEGQFLRSNSKADRLKRKSTSLVKALIDADSVLAGEKTRLIPVVSATNNDVLIPAYSYGTDITGEAITTAPLKVDTDIPLMGVSQTAAQLGEGVRDNTDALDDTLVLEKLFYKLDDGTDSSVHSFDVSGFTSARWVPTAAGNSKDVALNFVTDAFTIDTTNTKQLDGTASVVLTNLSIPNHKIQVRAVMYGNGNTNIGDVTVTQGKLELVSIKDSAGNVIPTTDATYTAVKAIIDGMVIEGYTLEAYVTNSNLRNIGYILSSETITTVYSVSYRTPISVLKPQIHAADTDNDGNKIKSFGNQSRAMSTVLGINKLIKYAGFLRSSMENGADLTMTELAGAAKDLVNPYYAIKTVDLETSVDSINSKDLKDNVGGALAAVIGNAVNEMMDESGYLDAFENTQNGIGAKPTIIIATDRKIKNILTNANNPISLGDSVNVKVVSTGSKLFTNKIMIMPTTGKKDPSALNFGFRAFIPTPTVEIKRSVNGTSINALYNQPCFEFINLLPVLTELDVTGFEAVTKKLPTYTREV